MTRVRQWGICGLAALSLLAASAAASAQETAEFPVAVLNLDVLFKEDAQVQKALADLKQEAAEIDEKVKLRQSEIETVQADMRKAQPGSQEQRRLQQQGFKLAGELQRFVNDERANVAGKEAKIFLAAYRRVDGVVKEYCQEKGIKLVIRDQAGSLEANQSTQEIVKAVNRFVIFEDGLDITKDIQGRLKSADKEE